MKKYIVFFTFIFSILLSNPICSAQDLYIGENNRSAIYLRTESISADAKIVQGVARTTVVINYTTVAIPNKERLDELRKLCLDNTITHSKQTYKVLVYYDRITGKWSDDIPYVTLEKSSLYNDSNVSLFKEKDTPRFVCSLSSPEPKNQIHRDTYEQVTLYLRDHKEVFQQSIE